MMIVNLFHLFYPYYFYGLLIGCLLRFGETCAWEPNYLKSHPDEQPSIKWSVGIWLFIHSIAIGLPLAFILFQIILHYYPKLDPSITAFLITTFSAFIAADLRSLLGRLNSIGG
jgi:hypothetical protein